MVSLLLIRHGLAAPRGAFADDSRRPLTREGILRTTAVARGMARLASPTLVLTSPLLRAAQTADLVAAACSPTPPVRQTDLLGGSPNNRSLARLIGKEASENAVIALVGHEPHMGMLAAWLVCGNGEARIEFKKASVCRIDFDGEVGGGRGRLAWLCPPKVLTELADR
ncbi:MAG: hypothetical protein BIFFINMI_02231 [Phycisphaerae bacterium]|nr:hypothetical protein [Phycisphaerae bacterium]